MKNKKLLMGGLFVVFLISLVGTYAFYTATASNNNIINATAASANLELTVTKSAGGTTLVPQLTQYLQSALTGTNGTSCVDGNGNTVCQVYTITIENKGTATALLSGTLQLTAASMDNLKWEELATINTRKASPTSHSKTDTIITDSLSLAKNASKTYYVAVWIDETGSNQNDSGSFNGTVSFNYPNGEGVTSSFLPPAAETIMHLATSYATATATSGIYAVEHNKTEQLSANTDYRYYGPSPDNYATFNGESWRVIGVFKTNDNDYHVKLIKVTALSSAYVFDSSNSDYDTSTLKTYLNGTYYDGLTSKSLVELVTYYTAGGDNLSDKTPDMYRNERGRWGGTAGIKNTTTYIGLMYPSDYGYAAGKTCVSGTTLNNYDGGCGLAASNWMYLGLNEWLISPDSTDPGVWLVNSYGKLEYQRYNVNNEKAVRPVLYLKSTVKIKSGDGTTAHPFEFEL